MNLHKLLDELESDLDDRYAETRAAEIVNEVSPYMARLGHASLVREWTPAAQPIEARRYLAECIAATAEKPEPSALTPPQVAKQLGCRASRVLAWIKAGQLKASNLATGSRPRYRIQPDDLVDFLKRRQPELPQARPKKRRPNRPKRF